MIFLIPLAVGLGSLIWILMSDMDLMWKIFAGALFLGSLAFQFVPLLQIHFLIPLIMQSVLAIWGLIHFKMSAA